MAAKKTKWTIKDMTHKDKILLSEAYHLSYRNPGSFICFGKTYYKFKDLKLVGEDYCVTRNGIKYLQDYYEEAK